MILGRYNNMINFDNHLEFNGTPKQPYIVVTDTTILTTNYPNYTDVTSIENVFKYGEKAKGDYIAIRKFCKELFYDVNKLWVNCNNIERDIVIDYSFYMKDDNINATTEKITHLMNVKGMSQLDAISYLQNAYSIDHINMSKSCNKRGSSQKIYSIIAKYLNNIDGLDFKNTIRTLFKDYKEDALLGTTHSSLGLVGIIDYLNSTVGTIYEGVGLMSKGYTMQNGDTDATNLITELNGIFIESFNYE